MILGGVETAVAFGLTVFVAKVIKDSIKQAYAKQRERNDRLAAELAAAEPERLKRIEEEQVAYQKTREEQRAKEIEEKKKADAEAAIKAEAARKTAIPFSDFEKGFSCPKCGHPWMYPAKSTPPQACNCSKCLGTHFHIICTGTVRDDARWKTIGCQANFLMLAKDNTKES